MNVLFVNACVRRESRTRLLCHAYKSKRFSDADTINERFLTAMQLSPLDEQTLLTREQDCLSGDFSLSEYRLAKEFANADEIVIGAPYWDCSFPAILKVYFEHICVNGITFGYGEGGAPQKLCRAKQLVYITTAGGYFSEQNSAQLYLQELLHMFGIPELRFFSAQGLDIRGNDVNKMMEQASKDVCRLASLDRE